MSKGNLLSSYKFFKRKKVLVTGGGGFIGSNLIEKLLGLDADIYSTVHRKNPQIKDRKVKYVKSDLTQKKDCEKVVRGMDYVFMCAANTSGAAVIEKTPLAHVTPNVIMNTLMLEAAYEARVKKFLFISSNTVYPVTDYPVKEGDMLKGEPFEKYFSVSWMKRFSEIMCQMYSTKINPPMLTVVVRPANAYGPYDDFEWETSHVIPALIRKVVERHVPIEVWGNGKDIKDLIFVKDLVEGLLLAMEKVLFFRPLNIGTGNPVSVAEMLDIILEVDEFRDAKIVFNKSKPQMIPKRLIDVSLAKSILGFKSKTGHKEGIGKTISWYREIKTKSTI